MAILQNTTFNTTTALTLPNQTQSTAGATGKIRFSTASGTNTLEFYDGTTWRPVTGFSAGLIGTGGDSIFSTTNGIVHIFSTVGAATFTPTFTGNVQVLVVGGGGSSGYDWCAGGGGGGVIQSRSFPVSNGTGVPISVGGGGAGRTPNVAGPNGGNSVFGSLTALGGGGGGSWNHSSPGAIGRTDTPGRTGASGGGGSNTGDGVDSRTRSYGGVGTAGQGFPGGSGVRFNQETDNAHMGGGGGGAGGRGGDAPDTRTNRRSSFNGCDHEGGAGAASDILNSVNYFGGGGAGGAHYAFGHYNGGIGGGGGGSSHHSGPYNSPSPRHGVGGGMAINAGQNGQPTARGGTGGANTGGGGGGGQHGADGGSGVVIVKY